MGMLLCVLAGFGPFLVVTAPHRLFVVRDFSNCYAPPPVTLPCERIAYQGGLLDVVFTALCGVMLVGVALWLLWELWSAVEPKPITDDFLRLLNHSFGHSRLNPFGWPWARMLWAYGFTSVGVALAAGLGVVIWASITTYPAKQPTVHVETSQSFVAGP